MLRHVTGPQLVVHGRSKPTFQQIGLGVLELAEAQGVPKTQGRSHAKLLRAALFIQRRPDEPGDLRRILTVFKGDFNKRLLSISISL